MSKKAEILSQFLNHAGMMQAIEAAAQDYCATTYQHRTSSLNYLTSDGMARHGQFNRTLADFLSRFGAEGKIRFMPKRQEGLDYIGDLVFYEPYKGQAR